MSTLLAQGLGENTFFESVIELGVREGIRTGEQIEIGKSMQNDIEIHDKDKEYEDEDIKNFMKLLLGDEEEYR